MRPAGLAYPLRMTFLAAIDWSSVLTGVAVGAVVVLLVATRGRS